MLGDQLAKITAGPKTGILKWAAHSVWRAAIPVVVAILLSTGLHVGFPLISKVKIKKTEAVSIMEIIGAPPPDVPMPENDVPIDAPIDEEVGEPMAGEKNEEPSAAAPEEAPTPPPANKKPDNSLKLPKNEDLQELADRLRSNRQKRTGSNKAGGGNGKGQGGQGGKGKTKGGGAAQSSRTVKGVPGKLYQCSKHGLVREIKVRKERRISDWVTIIPTVVSPFKSRPSLRSYLPSLKQIVTRDLRGLRRYGPVEFSLPSRTLQLYVEKPSNYTMVVGKSEGRCLIGLKYTRDIFPLEIRKAPVRFLSGGGSTVDAVVNLTLYPDGSFSVKSTDGTRIPFRTGNLKNSSGIKKNIERHFAAVDRLKKVGGFFGIDVDKAVRNKRKKKARSEQRKKRRNRRR